ncbi:thioredoxin-like domain-containing protein [Arachidicoccus sp.]|uniref:thioredoxin-like domain-containing protein n=1 Tax=Arachidicoccus sp. TaxID=1872624 RepID=UPI003D221769
MFLKYLFSLPLIFTTFIACAQGVKKDTGNNSFHLSGNFIGNNTKFLILSYRDANNKIVTDTSNIVNRQFYFSGNIKEPTFAFIMTNFASYYVADSNNDEIFIEPNNMKINIEENHFKTLKLSDSKTQSQYDSLEKSKSSIYKNMAPLDAELAVLNDSISASKKRQDTAKVYQMNSNWEKLIAKMQPYKKQLNQIDLKYVIQNPSSYLSAYLLNQQFQIYRLEKDSVKLYYNRLSATIQKSNWGKEIKRKFDGVINIGEILPNLKGTNRLDEKVSLTDLIKSNYTLIVFWASWCVPCRESVPAYKALYNEYHKKGLDIIAITWDEKKENWLTAIKKDNSMNWANVFPNKGYELRDIYGLSSIPAEILLKKNVIIGKYAGADDEHSGIDDIENKLKQIFSMK